MHTYCIPPTESNSAKGSPCAPFPRHVPVRRQLLLPVHRAALIDGRSRNPRRDSMRVAVLGAGAIGAYVGAALHRGETETHLIARGPHLEAIRAHGVQVLSPRGDFVAETPATDDPAEVGPVDYVFLGLKANSYASCGALI